MDVPNQDKPAVSTGYTTKNKKRKGEKGGREGGRKEERKRREEGEKQI